MSQYKSPIYKHILRQSAFRSSFGKSISLGGRVAGTQKSMPCNRHVVRVILNKDVYLIAID